MTSSIFFILGMWDTYMDLFYHMKWQGQQINFGGFIGVWNFENQVNKVIFEHEYAHLVIWCKTLLFHKCTLEYAHFDKKSYDVHIFQKNGFLDQKRGYFGCFWLLGTFFSKFWPHQIVPHQILWGYRA